jgi:hypothetical protein
MKLNPIKCVFTKKKGGAFLGFLVKNKGIAQPEEDLSHTKHDFIVMC